MYSVVVAKKMNGKTTNTTKNFLSILIYFFATSFLLLISGTTAISDNAGIPHKYINEMINGGSRDVTTERPLDTKQKDSDENESMSTVANYVATTPKLDTFSTKPPSRYVVVATIYTRFFFFFLFSY